MGDELVQESRYEQRFNKNGTIRSEAEVKSYYRKIGVCDKCCNIRTHKQKKIHNLFSRKPLTNDDVYKGICISCNPSSVPKQIRQTWEARNPPMANGGRRLVRQRDGGIRLTTIPDSERDTTTTNRRQSTMMMDQNSTNSSDNTRRQQQQQDAALDTSRQRRNTVLTFSDHARRSTAAATTPQSPFRGGATDATVYSAVPTIVSSGSSASNPSSGGGDSYALPFQHEQAAMNMMMNGRTNSEASRAFQSNLASHSISIYDCLQEEQSEGSFSAMSELSEQTSAVDQFAKMHFSCPSSLAMDEWAILENDRDNDGSAHSHDHSGNSSEISPLTKSHDSWTMSEEWNGKSIQEIFAFMEKNRDNPKSASVACLALWKLVCGNHDKKLEAGEFGTMDAVLDALRVDGNLINADFCENAFGFLTSMVLHPQNKQLIVESCGIEQVLRVLNLRKTPSVFEWACRLLYVIITAPQTTTKPRRKSHTNEKVDKGNNTKDGMQRLEPNIQEEDDNNNNESSSDSDSNGVRVADSGGEDNNSSKKSSSVDDDGDTTSDKTSEKGNDGDNKKNDNNQDNDDELQNLIEKNIADVLDLDGISVVIKCIKVNHLTKPEPIRWALMVLCRLLQHPDNSSFRSSSSVNNINVSISSHHNTNRTLKRMMDEGFLDVAVSLLKEPSKRASQSLFQLILEMLFYALHSPEATESIHDLVSASLDGCIRVLDGKYRRVCTIQQSCFQLFAKLASDGSENSRRSLIECGTIGAILNALENFTEDARLCETALWSLWAISYSSGSSSSISSGDFVDIHNPFSTNDVDALKGICQLVTTVGKAHKDCPQVLYPLCGFFANVCSLGCTIEVSDIPSWLFFQSLQIQEDGTDASLQTERAILNVLIRCPDVKDEFIISEQEEEDANFEESSSLSSCMHRLMRRVTMAGGGPSSDQGTKPGTKPVGTNLIYALSRFAEWVPDSRSVMRQMGLLDALCTLLQDSDSSSRSLAILELIGLLVGTTSSDSNGAVILELPDGFYRSILDALEHRISSSDTRKTACVVLRNLIVSSFPSNNTTIVNDDCMGFSEAIVHCMIGIMNSQQSDAELRTETCYVLWALTAKYPDLLSSSSLREMFLSMLGLIHKYRYGNSFNLQLLLSATGALAYITESARRKVASGEDPHPLILMEEDIDELMSLPYNTLDKARNAIELYDNLMTCAANLAFVNEDVVLKAGVVVVIADLLHEFETEPTIQEKGMAALAILSSQEDLHVNLGIVQTDGIDLIVNCLAIFLNYQGEDYDSAKNIALHACKALAHLTTDDESRVVFSSLGGLDLLLNAMKQNMDCIDLLQGACKACLNITSDAEGSVILGSDIVETVIMVMRRYIDDIDIQVVGISILQNISIKNMECRKRICDAGGIIAVTNTIKQHTGGGVWVDKTQRENVLERSFATLWSLTVLKTNHLEIADADGIFLVITGMMIALTNEQVQIQACGCLSVLATCPINKGAVTQYGGVDAIVYAMRAHFRSEALQIEACKALANFSLDINTNEIMSMNVYNECKAVIIALQRYPDNEKLQERGCIVLRNFLLSIDNINRIIQYNADMNENVHVQIQQLVRYASSRYPETCGSRAEQILKSLDPLLQRNP